MSVFVPIFFILATHSSTVECIHISVNILDRFRRELSPHGQNLVAAIGEGIPPMVGVWDMTKRMFLRTLQTSEADMILSLFYFSPDGNPSSQLCLIIVRNL